MVDASSELNEPKLIELYGDDYDYTSLYREPFESLREGYFLDFISSVYEEEEGDFTSNGKIEYPFHDRGNWLGHLESYFGGYGVEDSHGYGALEYTTEDLREGEVEASGYYSYDDDMGFSGYGFGFGYGGGEEDGNGYGREEVESEYGKSLDEMRLCESIFGYWPGMSWNDQECYIEEGHA